MEGKKRRWFPLRPKKGPDREIQELIDKIEEKPDDARLHQRLAELYLDKGSKEKAIDGFTKAAECHSEAGFYLRAIALYRRILRMQSESPEILLRLAELYLVNGLLGDALVQFRKVIHKYRNQGKKDEILDVLDRMAGADPGNLEIRMKYIELLQTEGFGPRALDELIRVYAEHQDKASQDQLHQWREHIESLHEDLRNQLMERGDEKGVAGIDQKMEALFGGVAPPVQPAVSDEDVIDLEMHINDSDATQSMEADAEEAMEADAEEAMEMDAEEAMEMDAAPPSEEMDAVQPVEVEAAAPSEGVDTAAQGEEIMTRLSEAVLYAEQGLFDEAESLYEEVLGLEPGHAEALKGLESVRNQRDGGGVPSEEPSDTHDLDDLETRSQAAAGEDVLPEVGPQAESEVPEDARVRYELGIAYRDLGLFDECLAELRTAARDPSLAFASYRGMGECCANIGDHDQAITHFQQALRCEGAPEEERLEITYQLAQVFEQGGKTDKALRMYQRIAEMNSTYRDVNERIASLSQ